MLQRVRLSEPLSVSCSMLEHLESSLASSRFRVVWLVSRRGRKRARVNDSAELPFVRRNISEEWRDVAVCADGGHASTWRRRLVRHGLGYRIDVREDGGPRWRARQRFTR